ncbi:MAG: bifunctional alpha/beta hydrolase/class I SAM-dependent methyltransferase [Alphaproteobacteria bacterium]|nr:bifunctional alpha/beta hydrolase/class I SAM-dependent methyltransferase [Alphaproteobacteria bacterium]
MKHRPAEEKTFATHDGQTLFYRSWPSISDEARGAVVLLHRGHEHSGRLAHLVHELNLPEFAFFAWDARGHGRSSGERGFSPSVGTSVRDVQTFIDHVRTVHGFSAEDIVVVGQSVGAVLAAAWAHDYAPNIRALVLASPAFQVKLYVPLARPVMRLAQALAGNFFVNSYVNARLLTHDPARIASFESDPLISRAISSNMLLGLHDLSKRIVEDASAITIPTQLLISGSDWVVREGPQHRFYERLGATVKERHVFEGFYHDILGEKDRKQALDKARAFIQKRFRKPLQRPSLLDADKQGFTCREAAELARPLSALSLRRLYWSATRLGMKIGGWISRGIRIGHKTGFDSGSTLDYVYRNEPQGLTPLGRAIDKGYLNSVGWKGIRQRKVHVEELLGSAVDRVRGSGAPVRILDIAAGHGRYVLEAMEKCDSRPDSILLRDYSDLNVNAGSRLIEKKGLSDIATFVKGDAFDPDSLAGVAPRPTVGVVSGLYELFADNALVRASLEGLARAIPDHGYLVYTGQPWHPQLELIARTLTSHRQGRPWIMRRRTQAEMDQLVAAAGFEKVDQRIDEWGIFTVSLARKTTRQARSDRDHRSHAAIVV